VHFPKQVRSQLKILSVQNNDTLRGLVAKAFSNIFAKCSKPEMERAPSEHLDWPIARSKKRGKDLAVLAPQFRLKHWLHVRKRGSGAIRLDY